MNNIVLDASALIALINEEKGWEIVKKHLPNAIMSSVNVSETAATLTRVGMPINESKQLINELINHQIDFDKNQAYTTASLRPQTKAHGLSFGDRACLSLGKTQALPVLTADRIWQKIKIGVKVQVIR